MAESLADLRYVSSSTGVKFGSFSLFDPHHRFHRYLALLFICLFGFGSAFCYDGPSALADIIQKDMALSIDQYTRLYSWYSWPNIVLCFIGGYLIDRVFGVRLGTLVFSAFCILGQTLFASAAFLGPKGFWLMQVGEFVFGIGGESLAVAQSAYSVIWFRGNELNMVFGLQLSFSRVAATLSMNTMSPIYNSFAKNYPDFQGHVCLALTLFVGAGVCVFSFLFGFLMLFLDTRAAKVLNRKCNTSTEDPIRITDIRVFPISFWFLCIICVTYYSAVYPFISVGKLFFLEKFQVSESSAGLLNSMVYLISTGTSPIFGIIVDYIGYNINFLIVAISGTLVSHFLLAFTSLNPWFAMVLMGITYSLCACAIWPIVALIIPDPKLGTAYGIMQSIQNLGFALTPLACGAIVEARGYIMLEVFFICCLFVALFCNVSLCIVDKTNGIGLNISTESRKKFADKEKQELKHENKHLLALSDMSGSRNLDKIENQEKI